jgi:hypothetical protein
MVRDPKLIDPNEPRIPDSWRRLYLHRPLEKLPEDVTVLFDRQEKLSREKDLVQADLLQAQRGLDRADLRIWVLMGLMGLEACIIGWLVKAFLEATRW